MVVDDALILFAEDVTKEDIIGFCKNGYEFVAVPFSPNLSLAILGEEALDLRRDFGTICFVPRFIVWTRIIRDFGADCRFGLTRFGVKPSYWVALKTPLHAVINEISSSGIRFNFVCTAGSVGMVFLPMD